MKPGELEKMLEIFDNDDNQWAIRHMQPFNIAQTRHPGGIDYRKAKRRFESMNPTHSTKVSKNAKKMFHNLTNTTITVNEFRRTHTHFHHNSSEYRLSHTSGLIVIYLLLSII
jgi:hypothetical protein